MKNFLHLFIFLLFSLVFTYESYSQCSAGEEEVTVKIHTDTWGSEITWNLKSPSETLLTGGPYADGSELEDIQTVCVPEGTVLTFTINDSQNDGICIGSGEAKYQIIAYNFIFAENCDYGSGETFEFTLESPAEIDAKLSWINIGDYISQEFTLKGTIYNNGLTDLTTVDFSWQIEAGIINTQTISGFSISSNQSVGIEYPTDIEFEDSLVTKKINIWISNPNGSADENTANDTIIRTVDVLDKFENRRVLIEHFTNASCDPCALQNPVLNALMAEGGNPDKIAHIAYHTHWPGTDPMYDFNNNNGEGDTRVSFYNVTGVPYAVISGNNYQGGPVGITQKMVDEEYAIPALVKIATEQEIIGDSVYVSAEIIALINLSSTKLKAHIALTDNKEYFFDPELNGETNFENVMRTMMTGADGYSLDPMNAYDTVRISFKKQIDTYEIDDPKVLVFVQDNEDNDILNAYLNEENIGPLGVKANIEDGFENYISDERIVFHFNDPVRNIDNSEITDPSSLIILKEDNSSGAEVAFTTTINDEKTKINVIPNQWLEEDKTYYISLQSLENEEEFSYSEKQYTFTMGQYPATKVIFYPRNGDTYISRDGDLILTFDMAVRLINNDTITDPAAIVKLNKKDQNDVDVPLTATIDSTCTRITINPNNALEPEQYYTLRIIGGVIENKYNTVINDTSVTFKTGVVSGITKNIIIEDTKIYPNPTNGNISIDLNINKKSAVIVRIYNQVGQLVQTEDKGSLPLGNQHLNLNLEKLKNGLYFIKIVVGNEAITHKIQIIE
jgi:hypothetical protein